MDKYSIQACQQKQDGEGVLLLLPVEQVSLLSLTPYYYRNIALEL